MPPSRDEWVKDGLTIRPTAGGGETPTRARFGVLGFLCTLALVLYLDRVCIGQAEKSIREDLGLDKSDMGLIATAFTLAYVLFEVPMGHWGDRFGSRGVIARIVVWWSVFTALTGSVDRMLGWFIAHPTPLALLAGMMVVRFLFGAGEAGAFPNTARVVTRWFPPQARGRARGAITTTSLLGGAMAPSAAAFLIGQCGWRWTFVIFGSLGIVWALAFYAWFRDDPARHPAVNDAERALIDAGLPVASHDELAAAHHSIPWARVLSSPNVWLMGAIMSVGASLFYVLFNWFPTYLKEGHHASEMTSGWLTSLVMTGGAVGCISGGFLADWIVHRTGERRWSRCIVGSGGLSLAAVCVGLIPFCPSPVAAAGCAAAALCCTQLTIPTWWSVVADVSGPHGAAMFGLMNSLGGFGAMGAPWAAARIVESLEKRGVPSLYAWTPVFLGGAAILLTGAVCWLQVNATRSVVACNEPKSTSAGS